MDTDTLTRVIQHWDVRPVREWNSIEDGVVFEAVTDDGARYALKDRGELDPWWRDRLPFEHDVTNHVYRCGVPVARLLETREGEPVAVVDGRFYSLSPAFRNRPTELTREDALVCYGNCGRAIARMHQALATYPTEGVGGKTWHADLHDRIVTTCIPYVQERMPEAEAAPFARRLADVREDMERAYRDLPPQLIFWDCHPGNLVRDGAEVTGFVDCNHYAVGPRMFDVAHYLLHLVKWFVDEPDKTAAWLDLLPRLIAGYEDAISLTDHEKWALPCLLLVGPLMFMDMSLRNGEGMDHAELRAFGWLCDAGPEIARRMKQVL